MSNLLYGVNDVPNWWAVLFYGFQHAVVCATGLLWSPVIVADMMCAGSSTMDLKTQIVSATFVSAGIGTILQSTFGLRLAMMHGPAAAFLPALLSYRRSFNCSAGPIDTVPEEEWKDRVSVIAGSLFVACFGFVVIGCTDLAGLLTRRIGPITIIPVMLLLVCSLLPMIVTMMSTHWISVFTFLVAGTMVTYLKDVEVRLPRGLSCCFFGQFPLLLTLFLSWFLCFLLTITNLSPVESVIRTDRNATIAVLRKAAWIQISYPGQIGGFIINIGLTLALLSTVLVDLVENLGTYDLLSRVSNQKKAPKDAINRALIMEGIGSMFSAVMGVGVGLTTYSSSVVLIQVTRVASRITMPVAGAMLVLFGILPKFSAILASIPDPIIGGIMLMLLSMVIGVSLSNLQTVDLKVSRNLTIIGFSLVVGFAVPMYFEKNPIQTGYQELDEVLNMLLSIQMLVGGIVAACLDNTVQGASMTHRGLKTASEAAEDSISQDGYAFPDWATRFLHNFTVLRKLPFMPRVHPKVESVNYTVITLCDEKEL